MPQFNLPEIMASLKAAFARARRPPATEADLVEAMSLQNRENMLGNIDRWGKAGQYSGEEARDLFQAGRRDYRMARSGNRELDARVRDFQADIDQARAAGVPEAEIVEPWDLMGQAEEDAQYIHDLQMRRAQANPYWREIQASMPVELADTPRYASGDAKIYQYGYTGYDDYLDWMRQGDVLDQAMPMKEWQGMRSMQNFMGQGPRGKLPAMIPPALLAALYRSQAQRPSTAPADVTGAY